MIHLKYCTQRGCSVRSFIHILGDTRNIFVKMLTLYSGLPVGGGVMADRLDDVLLTYRVHGISRSDNKDNLKTDCLQFKTEYLLEEVEFPADGFTYMIWGSDFSGRAGHKHLEKVLPSGRLAAYIDSFREGMEEGIPVIKPEKIKSQNPDYIFICTNGGGEYARKYLDNIGYRQIEDYFKII